MSVRAVAVRQGTYDRIRVVPRTRIVPSAVRRAAARAAGARTAFSQALWVRFTDDRQLIGLKIVLLGAVLLVAMALEVPL